LWLAFFGRRTREFVIDEHHTMTDEDFILNCNAFTDKRVGRDFASQPDLSADLNLNECTDSRLIADATAIKINQVRMRNPHLFA
jgi:hypothetical protein